MKRRAFLEAPGDERVKDDIAFLHTSPAHVPTFEKLMAELAPGLRASHVVREDLLVDAQREGTQDPQLVARIGKAMEEAGAGGAGVVVCTCSTIGGVAEAVDTAGRFSAARIDRAMANKAVASGRPVLLVAALESTLGPTRALLESSSQRLGTSAAIETLVVPDAWTHFLSGDTAAYLDAIVKAVAAAGAVSKTVVLAQASMAPAAQSLARLGITALSSPRLGVQQAVALHAARLKERH